MTPAPSLIALFVAPLERAGIEYMITGGLAAVMYGHPRLTLDVDLVIRLRAGDETTLGGLWSPDAFYVPPEEVIATESARPEAGHCNVIHNQTMLRADIYFPGDDLLAAWAFGRRVTRAAQGVDARFAPIEYVILSKLRYYTLGGSDRHLRDIARMLEVSGADADTPAIDEWVERLGLRAAWEAARARVGRE